MVWVAVVGAAYTAMLLLPIPMFVIFLQIWTCNYPFGLLVPGDLPGQCDRFECWSLIHVIGLVLSFVALIIFIPVLLVGVTVHQRREQRRWTMAEYDELTALVG